MTDNSHATEDSAVEVRVLKGKSGNNNFNIDLGKSHYVISDAGGTDTLTFKNTKIENLEYSSKDGRAYIRDKKTQNVVTFNDSGYAERKRNLDKAYEAFNSTYQNVDVMNATKTHSYTAIQSRNALFEFDKMYDFYQKGRVPAALLSESIDNVNSHFDEIINIANSQNDEKSSELYTKIKTAFSDYTSQLVKLDINHGTVIEKIVIDGKVYDVSELLVSKPLDNPFTNPNKVISDISDVADITDVRMLRDNISDYTEQEAEYLNDEIYSADTMIEYMAGFKDLGQELGTQRLPGYFDFNPMHSVVTAN
ncbi:hypothetical protein [Yersinia kristensenii]|uniref:hypothetical protein n=1 Tax=Yersinia kristensenii TaxID=28152 RepID=UPI0011A46704|nr:hypothetical protein [Yersinia kristensenii]MBW5810800.1 hypothetical protein [Yersinia kristensenii]MBW5827769.1 hypothetical protein [Yersinia kristensenii]